MAKRGFKLGREERLAIVSGVKAGLSHPNFTEEQRKTLGPLAAQLLTERDSRGVIGQQSPHRIRFRYSAEERRLIAEALEYAVSHDPHGLVDSSERVLLSGLIPEFKR
jgi:hypothetical protein